MGVTTEIESANFVLNQFDPFGIDVAIVAAFIGGGFVLFQIFISLRAQKRERRSSFLARKASLPHLLSRICRWLEELVSQIESLHAQLNGNLLPANPQIPDWNTLASEHISDLRETIKVSENKRLTRTLVLLLRETQVLEARLESMHRDTASHYRPNIEQYMLDGIEAYVIAESLFEYARDEARVPPKNIDWKRIHSFAFRKGYVGAQFEGLTTHASRVVERRQRNERSYAAWVSERAWRYWYRLVIGEWPKK